MTTPSKQQKVMLKHMAGVGGFEDYKTLAEAVSIKADGFRAQLAKMEKNGWVKSEEDGSPNWGITEEGMALVSTGDADLSMADVGVTESQIFQGFGRTTGGLPVEKLQVIAQIVFSDDPYNLDKVWLYLGRMNIPIDVRRSWWTCWDSYLRNSSKPVSISEQTKAAVTPPTERTEEQKKEAEKQQLDWDLETNPQTGLTDLVKIGSGIGQYNLDEASRLQGLKNQQLRALASLNPPQAQQEPLSQLLSAIAPYIKKDTDEGVLRELITLQFANMTKAITDTMPKQGEKTGLEQITGLLASLKDLGPALRPLLGLPEPGAQAQNTTTPVQLQDGQGNPMVMNLADILTLKKFDAEQKMEERKAKGSEEFLSTVRGFVSSLGKAAERAAQPK